MLLISNIAFMWVIRIATLGSSALMSVATARALGPAGRGLFALPAIDASIANTFSVGLSSAAAYYLLNRKAGPQILRALSLGFTAFIIVGSFATVITAMVSRSTWAIGPALAYMIFYTAYSSVCGYYFGRDQARVAGITNATLSLVTLVFVTLSIWFFHRSASTAVNAWVCAIGLVAAAGVAFVCVDVGKLVGEGVDYAAFIRFGGRAGILNVASLLNYRVDIFIVAMLLPVATVGLYTIAVTGAESALSVTLAVGQATLPRIGSLGRVEAGIFVARCLRNTLFLATILCFSGIIAAPVLVGLLFGYAYESIVAPMRVLLFGIVAASTASLVSNYFVLNLGRSSVPLATSLLSTALCALVSFVLIPRLGMLGAAIASTAAYILSQMVALAYFCKASGIGALQVLVVDRRDLEMYGSIARRVVRM